MNKYDEIKTAALGLSAGEQGKLMELLLARHAECKAKEAAGKASGWKKTVWTIVGIIASLIAGIVGTLTMTGCTTAVKQSQTAVDGSITTKERYFSLSASEARDLVRLYGIPMVPVVETGK